MNMISKHGVVANLLLTGNAYVEPEVIVQPRPQRPARPPRDADEDVMATYEDVMEDYKLLLAEYTSDLTKARDRRAAKVQEQEDRSKRLYADICLQLAKDTEDKVKDHPTFGGINRDLDPVRLWNLIVLLLTYKDKQDEAETQASAFDTYILLKIADKELISDFKRRIDNCIQSIDATGLAVPSQPVRAQNFFDRLNPLYAKLVLSYANKERDKPITLSAAYQHAADYRVLSTYGTPVAVNDVTALMASTEATVEKADRSKSDNAKSDKGKKKKSTADIEAKQSQAADTLAANPNKDRKVPSRDCNLCAHLTDSAARRDFQSDCPRLATIKELIKDGTIAAMNPCCDPAIALSSIAMV